MGRALSLRNVLTVYTLALLSSSCEHGQPTRDSDAQASNDRDASASTPIAVSADDASTRGGMVVACERASEALRDAIQHARAEGSVSCATDADCTLVRSQSPCMGCGEPTALDHASMFRERLDSRLRAPCDEYTRLGCSMIFGVGICLPVAAVCNDGACVLRRR
jgi:hypothetical protein